VPVIAVIYIICPPDRFSSQLGPVVEPLIVNTLDGAVPGAEDDIVNVTESLVPR
jgi:hypothetical protein